MWQFKAATEVRTAVTIDVDSRDLDPGNEQRPIVRAVFADRAAESGKRQRSSGREYRVDIWSVP